MIQCPACSHSEYVGTLYCSECGTRLVHSSRLPDLGRRRDRGDLQSSVTRPAPPAGPELQSGAIVGLKELTSGQILSLIGRDNFTLGRSLEGQAIIPDVDLNTFEAYDHGVSRIHAEIRLEADGAYVLDLDSANGTSVNGERLEPQTPTSVEHGDIIQLGGLKLQLISRYRSTAPTSHSD